MQYTNLKAAQPDFQLSGEVNLYSGNIKRLGKKFTGIDKQPVSSRVVISRSGILGDQVYDTKHHGGIDRALLCFPQKHYEQLQKLHSGTALRHGCLGENISTDFLDEQKVFIGDRFQLGSTILEVSEPRSPCYKLGIVIGVKHAPLLIQENSMTGFFLRVIQEGLSDPTDQLKFLSRDNKSISIADALAIYYDKNWNNPNTEKLLHCNALSAKWKGKIQRRLSIKKLEDWNKRLYGE